MACLLLSKLLLLQPHLYFSVIREVQVWVVVFSLSHLLQGIEVVLEAVERKQG
jgi:hypothetical protein